MMKVLLSCLILVLILYGLFFLVSKSVIWNPLSNTSFECGFSSYFFSRFSFSIHYFLIGMIFLFLDLEICLVLPFFNSFFDGIQLSNVKLMFLSVLTLGLLYEWVQGALDWKF